MGSGLAFCPKNEEPNMRAQKRARATGVVLARKVISGARRFSPDVRRGKIQRLEQYYERFSSHRSDR